MGPGHLDIILDNSVKISSLLFFQFYRSNALKFRHQNKCWWLNALRWYVYSLSVVPWKFALFWCTKLRRLDLLLKITHSIKNIFSWRQDATLISLCIILTSLTHKNLYTHIKIISICALCCCQSILSTLWLGSWILALCPYTRQSLVELYILAFEE